MKWPKFNYDEVDRDHWPLAKDIYINPKREQQIQRDPIP
jgi:hypothetical protein